MNASPAPNYTLDRLIGKGGFGEVWQVRSTTNGEEFALKFPLATASGEAVQRFRREVRLQSQLRHPNVLPLIDYDIDAAVPWHITPLMDSNLTNSISAITWEEAIACFRDVLLAVDFAHKNRVLHRDLNPNNVLLARSTNLPTRALLSDFGLGRTTSTGHATSLVTDPAIGAGTRGFVAPEQWASLHAADERSDIYSLGRLLEFIVRNVEGVQHIRARLEYCVTTATSLNPEYRYQSAPQFASDVEIVLTRPESLRRPVDISMELLGQLVAVHGAERVQPLHDLAELLFEHRDQEKYILGFLPMVPVAIVSDLLKQHRPILIKVLESYAVVLRGPLTVDTALTAAKLLEDLHDASDANDSTIRVLCLQTILAVATSHDIAEMAYVAHRILVSESDPDTLMAIARFISADESTRKWCATNLGQSMLAPVLLNSFDKK